MSLPGNALSAEPSPGDFLPADALGRPTLTIDYERGGIALNDPSAGLDYQIWRARYTGGQVLIGPSPYTSETVALTVPGITELSLSFDQNMNVALAYVASGAAFLYWYDTVIENYTTTALAAGVTSPFLTLDDKRAFASTINTNDVLLFYLRDGMLRYRQQRDRYNTERDLYTMPSGEWRIKRLGMTRQLRVQVELEAAL